MENRNRDSDFLSNLNKDFKKSKAEQIWRLLKDQECLNQKFKEFALESGNSGTDTDEETGNLTDSDESIHETERRLAERICLRRHSGVRCKTSMGFRNVTEYDGDSGIESRDPSANPSNRTDRLTNSNPRRRLYTPRTESLGLSLDIGDLGPPDEPVIESARTPVRPKSGLGAAEIRHELSVFNGSVNQSIDSYIRRRPRIPSGKIEPLSRKTPIKGFCENEVRSFRQEELTRGMYSPLPPTRSFTPQTFAPIAPEQPTGRKLYRSNTISDRSIRSGNYASQPRSFTPIEASLHSRSDNQVLGSNRPRRKLPDIGKAKALTLMKLPPLESSNSVNNREFLTLSKEPCSSDIRC